MLTEEAFLNCGTCGCTCLRPYLTPEGVADLMVNRAGLDFQSGDTIIKQGAFVSDVYYLREGAIKKCIEEKKGRSTLVQVLQAGSFFALPFHRATDRYPYSVVALSNVHVCQIRQGAFLSVVDTSKEFCHAIFNSYSDESHYLSRRISSLSSRNNHGRIALALLYLSESFCNGNRLFEALSRKDIADLASVSLESVNKILVELKHERIIDFDSKGIQILKPDLVRTLSEVG